jgi:hypothetical protein
MKKNTLVEISNDELLKKRNLVKGVAVATSIIYSFIIAFVVYYFVTKGFKNHSTLVITPFFVCALPLGLLFIHLGLINKEIKSRQL